MQESAYTKVKVGSHDSMPYNGHQYCIQAKGQYPTDETSVWLNGIRCVSPIRNLVIADVAPYIGTAGDCAQSCIWSVIDVHYQGDVAKSFALGNAPNSLLRRDDSGDIYCDGKLGEKGTVWKLRYPNEAFLEYHIFAADDETSDPHDRPMLVLSHATTGFRLKYKVPEIPELLLGLNHFSFYAPVISLGDRLSRKALAVLLTSTTGFQKADMSK